MRIEDQVCSLESAKLLKKLGVKQESAFYWQWIPKGRFNDKAGHYLYFKSYYDLVPADSKDLHSIQRPMWGAYYEKNYSAFTVPELGEILPRHAGERSYPFSVARFKSVKWRVGYWVNGELGNMFTDADSEAEARAKMLIILIERKLVNVERL